MSSSSSSSPNQVQLRRAIELLVHKVDLNNTGVKQFTNMLSQQAFAGANLKGHKDFIRATLTELINQNSNNHIDNEDDDEPGNCRPEEHDGSGGDVEEESHSEEDSDENDGDNKKAKKAGGGGGGLAARKPISDKLSQFLKQGNEMARTDIVKSLWNYIRQHKLQNPNNKREILLDKPMQHVFGCKQFTMFTMNKYIGAHVHPFKPVDLTHNTSTSKKSTSSTTAGSKRKTRGSGGNSSKGKASTPDKKKRKVGSQPPYRLSPELQRVVGKSILPRPQVVSAIWEYIKANNLQNPADKREILCDDKLRAVMKKSKVSMFTMNQLISPHLVEKVDKEEYQHEGQQQQEQQANSSSESEEEGDESEEDGDDE